MVLCLWYLGDMKRRVVGVLCEGRLATLLDQSSRSAVFTSSSGRCSFGDKVGSCSAVSSGIYILTISNIGPRGWL